MSSFTALIKRDTKLFFKDKGLFFTSLITPAILLVLYSTFLGNVFEDSFRSALESSGFKASDGIIGSLVSGQLVSSLLAVCCVTVAFCSNMLMVQDKMNGARKDLTIAPVKNSTISLAYYISNLLSTLLICYGATIIGLLFISKSGWYLSTSDVLFLLLDVFLLTLFGSALSSIINSFLSSQGQISAVGTIVSAGYGFICGAYMPISQFSEGLQKVISFMPGTYGTALMRNHTLNGVFEEMNSQGVPDKMIDGLKDTVDCNVYFFDNKVSLEAMYLILAASVAVLIALYVLISFIRKNKKK